MTNASGHDARKNKNIYVALLHYPVLGKSGETITSAVTSIDLHDIARAARTFGVKRFYVVTPLKDQQKLVRRIKDHWVTGYGAEYNPKRREALEIIRLADTLESVTKRIAIRDTGTPKIVVTSAKKKPQSVSFKTLRQRLNDGMPHLLVFGTAWGLAPEVIDQADVRLHPIRGKTDYNHLSVRSAATAVLDRLMGY